MQRRVSIAVIGGGMAGLSAAWRLEKRGFRDFVVLEMERQPGGNSRSGQNEVSRYPWAAHYVPVPNRSATLARELFEEFGILSGGVWDERYLCFAPQERLFLHGRWQEGIEPELGATERDRSQYKRFQQAVSDFRATGQFTIPMELGARPSPLANLSMSSWMRQRKFDSPYLRWYVDYACRDDYGASADATAAWAGIHYFAARESEEKGPITAPEGNGWIVNRLVGKLGAYIRSREPVYRVERDRTKFRVWTEACCYLADAVIFAAPTFLAHYIVDGVAPADNWTYSPWLTANLTLDRMPAQPEAEPAWDNVIMRSPSLGYVDSTHMSVASRRESTVWTYYWALAQEAPQRARVRLLQSDWKTWKELILADLEVAHPDIRACVSRIDVMRLGHAMIRPAPGFLFSQDRLSFLKPHQRLFFANSDLSGLSIFEEAQYRGCQAADRALAALR